MSSREYVNAFKLLDYVGDKRDLRAHWFYSNELLPRLSEDLQQAKDFFDKEDYESLDNLFSCWIPNEDQIPCLNKARRRAEIFGLSADKVEWLSVGLLELVTICHKSFNKRLALNTVDEKDIINSYGLILASYDNLKVDSALASTIGGEEVEWVGLVEELKRESQTYLNK